MPLADDAPSSRCARSPRLVRALLLGACGAGLLGLALPGSPPTVDTLTAMPAAHTSSLLERDVPHGPQLGARLVAQRASRSRPVAVKKVTRKAVKKDATLRSRWVRPSSAGVVSSYGMRDGRMHKGLDFGAGYGASIRAAADGVVIGSGYLSGESGYGLITLIRHKGGVVTAYAHQAKSFVHSGERVTAGESIGLVGSTGHSTGAHLHFEVRRSTHGDQVNPRTWLSKHGVYV